MRSVCACARAARVVDAVGRAGRIAREAVFACECGPWFSPPPEDPPDKCGRRWRALRGALGAACALALAACASIVPEVGDSEAVAEHVRAEVAAELGRSQVARGRHRILKVETERPYTGLKPIEGGSATELPVRFLGEEGISIPLDHALTPAEMAQHITASTGLPVRFIGRPPVGPEGRGTVRFTARGGRVLGGSGQWSGPLPALLDEWTGEHGYEWRYDADKGLIEVVRGVNAVFQIHALGGEQQYSVSSSTAGGQSASGETSTADYSQQRLESQYQFNPWPEIEKALGGLISEESRVQVSPSQASIIVQGLPGDVAQVRAYLRHVNRTVLRPIVVTMYVFSVVRKSGADFETDFSAALRTMAGGSSDFIFEGGRDGRTIGIVRPGDSEAVNSLELTLRALRTLGTVSRVLKASAPALNGEPALYYELVRHTYLAEISTTVEDGVARTERRPGAISSGFGMSYVGRITGPGEVMLRIFVSLQDTPTFREFGPEGNAIQLPEFSSRGISVTQVVREGETLVLSGFTDRVVSSQQEGFLSAKNPVAGATLHGDRTVDQVLLVTSRIGEPAGVSEVSEVRL